MSEHVGKWSGTCIWQSYTHTHTDTHTDRQTDRQTNRQIHEHTTHISVLARDSCKERCFLRDQSIAVVLITFFHPHQRKDIYLRAEEHRSLAL